MYTGKHTYDTAYINAVHWRIELWHFTLMLYIGEHNYEIVNTDTVHGEHN